MESKSSELLAVLESNVKVRKTLVSQRVILIS